MPESGPEARVDGGSILRQLLINALTWVPPAGFEPATKSLEGSCSVRLSYGGRRRAGDRVTGEGDEPAAVW